MPNNLFKTPTEAEEYVETTNMKLSCRLATTENITLSGIQTISNVTLVINDRVLVKDQTNASENGIYICRKGNWKRAIDMNTSEKTKSKSFTLIEEGTNKDKMFILTTKNPIRLGTTNIDFSELAGQVE